MLQVFLFLLNLQVVSEYLCVEGAVFLVIFRNGFRLELCTFPQTRREITQNVFFMEQYMRGLLSDVWGIWHIEKSKCSLSYV